MQLVSRVKVFLSEVRINCAKLCAHKQEIRIYHVRTDEVLL